MKIRTFSDSLGKIRSERKWTQARMAEAIDVSSRFYQALEKGTKKPSLKTLQKALYGLQLTYEEFFEFPAQQQNRLNEKELSPYAQLLVKLDCTPVLKAYVFAVSLKQYDLIDQLDLRKIVHQQDLRDLARHAQSGLKLA